MNEHEDLISRLRALGRRPVDTDVAEGHLSAMEAMADAEAPATGRHRLRIVAAFAVGLLAGTSGLATAGALPSSAQEVAHTALGAVGVKVPHGTRYKGPECGGAKNHGQYVRSRPKGERATAAASRCGKPMGAGQGGAPGDCQGPPPWAGKGKPDQAAKEARRQACGGQDDDKGKDKDTEDTTPAGPEGGTPNVAPQGPSAAVTIDPPTGDSPVESTTTTITAPTTTTTTGPEPAQEPSSTTTTGGGLDTTPPTPPETGLPS